MGRGAATAWFLLAWAARGEVVCALGQGVSAYHAASDERPSTDALELARRVNGALKSICGNQCPTMALFRNASAPNLMLVNNSGNAKMVYSPPFFEASYASFGDEGILALISHEVGHALDSTLGAKFVNQSWSPEVRADAWAGCVLAKLEAKLEPSLGALAKYPPPSHPAWGQRLPALRAGFRACGGDSSGSINGSKR
ncbi:MAG TPA: hypothetical protein VKV74_07590 [Bryobacteraceae bacterium]|nr:hypothetical protein [Bryobacteraceae bacterium]